jgi:predicted esterase
LRTWWAHPREMTYLIDTMENVMLRWRVDQKRIYLMGASMGGNGVWGFGSRCPELFAAFSPISGFYAGFLEFPLQNLSAKPVYILHGTRDSTVPIAGAREAFGILRKLNAPVEMREPECEHQPPNEELTRAAEWMLKKSNTQTFDLAALRDRVSKVPVAGWLRQYKGN